MADWIGSLGVGLLLLAFFLNLFGLLRRDALAYLILNALGGGMACYASHLIGFTPFVILEGTWCVVALTVLTRRLSGVSPGARS